MTALRRAPIPAEYRVVGTMPDGSQFLFAMDADERRSRRLAQRKAVRLRRLLDEFPSVGILSVDVIVMRANRLPRPATETAIRTATETATRGAERASAAELAPDSPVTFAGIE